MDPSALGRSASRKILLRLVSVLFLLFVISSIDRVNVSIAALRMNADLGMSAKAYGFGVSIFFLGYLLCQVPGVLLLKKIGVRAWVAGLVLAWGAIAACMSLMQEAWHFYALRFLLGVAEAAFAPGAIYYVSRWLPRAHRGVAISGTMVAVPVSVIVGAPLSGALLELHGTMGLAGWRWMFLIEGAMTIAMAVIGYLALVDRPAGARWLGAEEKAWLETALAREERENERGGAASPREAIRNGRAWASAGVWFSLITGAYGMIFWLPQLVKEASGLTDFETSVVSALPWVGVGVGMVVNAWHSDKTGERTWHVAGGALLAGAGLTAAGLAGGGWLALAFLVVAGLGLGAAQSVFWTIPTSFLGAAVAPSAIALINLGGNAGSLIAPNVIGWVRDQTGAFTAPVFAMAGLLLVGAVLAVLTRGRAQGPALAEQPAE